MRTSSWKRFFAVVVAIAIAGACTSHKGSYKGARTVLLSDIRFDDGDTFFIKDKPVRVLGIDTPEIAHPRLGIHEGQPYGDVAADSTRVMIMRAKKIEYVSGGRDRYRRKLAHVFLDGELLAVRLIRMGLAYETVSYYGDNGFPDLAQQIVDAARTSPKPKFESPVNWKRKQRKKRQKARSGKS